MIANNLVLSLFPGIDLLALGFQQEWPELCIVRGPDPIFNSLQDVRGFHVPSGVFFGIIGGPPCVGESNLAYLNGNVGYSLAPEFMRIVAEAQPDWWVMEAVIKHEAPYVLCLDNRWLGEQQHRKRYFHSNLNLTPYIEVSLFENQVNLPTVLAGHDNSMTQREAGFTDRSIAYMCRAQGLPEDFLKDNPFTYYGKRKVIGNAVPLPTGRAVAKAVRKATSREVKP